MSPMYMHPQKNQQRMQPCKRVSRNIKPIAALLVSLALWPLATIAANPSDGAEAGITQESLSIQRADIERASNITDEQKQLALAKIDESKALLDEAEKLSLRTQTLLNRIQEAPDQLKKLRQSMDVAELKLDQTTLELWTNEQLEVVLSERQLRLAEMQDSAADANRVLSGHLNLARAGGGELGVLETRLSALQSTPLTAAGAEALQAAESAWKLARERGLEAEISWLRTQQSNLILLTELAQRDRDLATAQAEAMKTHIAQLRDYVQKRRQAQAESAKQAAMLAVSDSPDAIKAAQRRISRIAAEHAELVAKETEFELENERLVRLVEDIKRAHERVEKAVELGGSTADVSNLLQKRRAVAPSPKALTRQMLEYQGLLSNASLRQLELDELLRDTRDYERQIDQMFAIDKIEESQRESMRQAAREVQSHYREMLLNLWKTYTRYISKLSTLDANTLQLLQVSKAYGSFIDDRLLWLPSTDLMPLHNLQLLFDGLRWFGLPQNLSNLWGDVWLAFSQQSLLFALWLTGLIVLIALHRRTLGDLRTAAATTLKVRTDSVLATVKSLGATLILILPLPWAFVGGGLLLGRLPGVHDYSAIVAAGLQGVGHTFLLLSMLRQICRTNGLARAHLSWHPVLCDELGKRAAWLAPLAAPLAFFSTAGTASVPSAFVHVSGVLQTQEAGLLSLGRLSMIALMLLLSSAIYRIWRKKGSVIQALADSTDRAKWAVYHLFWFVPAMAIPLFLALAASVGFYYTAAFLGGIAGETIWFVLAVVLSKDLVLRGLYVTQRRLRFEEALRHREESLAQQNEQVDSSSETTANELPLEEEKTNYGELGDQVRKLVKLGFTVTLLTGLWLIWSDVIPALNFLDEISLPISTTKLIDGVNTEVQLTLADVAAGLLLGGLALFAARNIPAVLELTILQRLPLSRASRYAVTTLSQYIVAMAGLIISFTALGLQWSNIQWLVAALSVGLGFGLQEIVANFISGIILLFEQPIRVGDVVTVDNTSGTVSRIRIRATTIVNWERQELIIPNKSFITGQLINWTLSDTVNRLFITVGVDYQTDTRMAMQLMAQIAAEHPKVLEEPAPRMSFEGFGDNALTLNMRAYLNDIDARIQTITELHQAILDSFREAGITIAFPQRDLHLDTNRPLELLLRKEVTTKETPT